MYNIITSYYNEIFPLSRELTEFVTKRIERGNILDIGCATGQLLNKLSDHDYNGYGLDLDKMMIQKAIDDRSGEKQTQFKVSDMRLVKKVFPDVKFNGSVILGNTLVHLQEDRDYISFFRDVYELLNDGGKFLIQILNYTLIKKNGISSLPDISSDKFVFTRKYRKADEDKIYFDITLETSLGKYSGTNILRTLEKDKLDILLKEAGFNHITYYGGFDGREFNIDESQVLIAECSR